MAGPLPPSVAALLVPDIEETEENEIIREVVGEMGAELYQEIDDAFPDLTISPGVPLKPRERLQRYRALLMVEDVYWIFNEDYIDLYKQGLAPPLLSMPWAGLLMLPKIFRRVQKDYLALLRAEVKEE